MKVFINSVISRLNQGYVRQLIAFAEKMSTTITFESVNQGEPEFPRKETQQVVDLRLAPGQEQQVFGLIRKLKASHRCINNSFLPAPG